MNDSLRSRIIDAAARRTVAEGWTRVTMGRLADDVGVSRQTVYNEVGSKGDLAEALVLQELGTFLARVETAFTGQPDDVAAAIRDSVRSVLRYAEQSPLLRAIVSSTHGAETDLLPLLTTRPETLLSTASTVLLELLRPYELPLGAELVERTVDVLVRTVLSQVIYPTQAAAECADHMAWMIESIIAGAGRTTLRG